MYTMSNPNRTMTLHFEGDEWEIVSNYAKWQGVEPTFFVALGLQTTIRTITTLFPQRLMMPGAVDRHIEKFGINRCKGCHETRTEKEQNSVTV